MAKRRCPDCREVIRTDARVCKHCGRRFSEAEVKAESAAVGPLLIVCGAVIFIVMSFGGSGSDKPVNNVQSAGSASKPKRNSPSPAMVMMRAEERLRDSLRDPSEAELRNKRVPPGSGYLCGEVNAPNAFGGRAGFQRFIAAASSDGPVVVEEVMTPSEFEVAWNRLC